jgi:hypothetical protein
MVLQRESKSQEALETRNAIPFYQLVIGIPLDKT